jgi:hypothetical protein
MNYLSPIRIEKRAEMSAAGLPVESANSKLLENCAKLRLSWKVQPRAVDRGEPTRRPSQNSAQDVEVVFAVASAVLSSFSCSFYANTLC